MNAGERYRDCEACGEPVDTLQPGVGKATNDEQWWHEDCFDVVEDGEDDEDVPRGERPIIGYVVDREAFFTVCASCRRDDDRVDGMIRDDDVYGDRVPYPECHDCGEVLRPRDEADGQEREWTVDEVDESAGYGSQNLAAYRCGCGTIIPVTFTDDTESPPDRLPNYPCGEAWDGCGEWRAKEHVETVRWGQ